MGIYLSSFESSLDRNFFSRMYFKNAQQKWIIEEVLQSNEQYCSLSHFYSCFYRVSFTEKATDYNQIHYFFTSIVLYWISIGMLIIFVIQSYVILTICLKWYIFSYSCCSQTIFILTSYSFVHTGHAKFDLNRSSIFIECCF